MDVYATRRRDASGTFSVAITTSHNGSAFATLLTDGCALAKQQPHQFGRTLVLAVTPCDQDQDGFPKSKAGERVIVFIPRKEAADEPSTVNRVVRIG
jgi:hypothetical protein